MAAPGHRLMSIIFWIKFVVRLRLKLGECGQPIISMAKQRQIGPDDREFHVTDGQVLCAFLGLV